MAWLKANLEPYCKEIKCLVSDLNKKRVELVFSDVRDYVNRYYVSKEVMATCIRAREKFQKQNHLLKKEIAGYKLLIKHLGLKELKLEPQIEVGVNGQTA